MQSYLFHPKAPNATTNSKSPVATRRVSTPRHKASGQIPLYLKATDNYSGMLRVSEPHEACELEAERLADRVMRSPASGAGADMHLNGTSASNRQQQPLSGLPGSGSRMTDRERAFFEPRFGADLQHVQIHNGTAAAITAKHLNARAFTLGNNIVFGAGEYSMDTDSGRHLLAHELAHTLQQDSGNSIRREVIDMEPMVVTPRTMPSDLSSLSTPVPASEMSMSHDQARIDSNSQLPGTVLPFTSGGWNSAEIANNLGQYDRIPGTDSDAVRCVQSVALISHVVSGPAAAISYLSAISAQAMLGAGVGTPRQQTAARVIEYVQRQIENRNATYGDMYWAMEAVHDLFYGDTSGTPAETPDEMRGQIAPVFDLTQSMSNLSTWCSSPADLMSQAATLNPGEQFMLNTWQVSFNYFFDMAGAAPTDQRTRYTQVDENDRPIRTVTINRIDTSLGKPDPSRIDPNRDSKSGHQMLIYKDAADNHIKGISINCSQPLAYRKFRWQGARLSRTGGTANECNAASGISCKPRRARPERSHCGVALLAKDNQPLPSQSALHWDRSDCAEATINY